MKKIFVVLACVAMLFSFASCDDGSGSSAAFNSLALAVDQIKAINSTIGDLAGKQYVEVGKAEVKYVDDTHANIVITIAPASSGYSSQGLEGTITIALTGEAFKDKETSHETTLTEGTISTDLKYTDALYNEYTFSVNGKVGIDGKLTITAPVKDKDGKVTSEGKAVITGATKDGFAFSNTVSINANGGVDAKTVLEKAGLDSVEDIAAAEETAKADATKAAKAFAEALSKAMQEATKSSAASKIVNDGTGDNATITVDVTGDNAATGVAVEFGVTITATQSGSSYEVTVGDVADEKSVTVTISTGDYKSIKLTGVTVSCDDLLSDKAVAEKTSAAFTSAAGATLSATGAVVTTQSDVAYTVTF